RIYREGILSCATERIMKIQSMIDNLSSLPDCCFHRASCIIRDRVDFAEFRGTGSGWDGFGLGDTKDLVDGESDQSEHQMAARFDGAAHPQKAAGELVFEACVDAFGHGAEVVEGVVRVGHVDQDAALALGLACGFAFGIAAAIEVDDRDMAKRS